MRRSHWLLALMVVVASLDTSAAAQQAPQSCTGDDVGDLSTFLQEVIRDHTIAQALSQPLTSPESKQVAAPAATGRSTLVNGATFPQLAGLALENKTGDVSNGVTTLNLDL